MSAKKAKNADFTTRLLEKLYGDVVPMNKMDEAAPMWRLGRIIEQSLHVYEALVEIVKEDIGAATAPAPEQAGVAQKPEAEQRVLPQAPAAAPTTPPCDLAPSTGVVSPYDVGSSPAPSSTHNYRVGFVNPQTGNGPPCARKCGRRVAPVNKTGVCTWCREAEEKAALDAHPVPRKIEPGEKCTCGRVLGANNQSGRCAECTVHARLGPRVCGCPERGPHRAACELVASAEARPTGKSHEEIVPSAAAPQPGNAQTLAAPSQIPSNAGSTPAASASPTDKRILAFIVMHPGSSSRELQDALHLSQPSTDVALSKLFCGKHVTYVGKPRRFTAVGAPTPAAPTKPVEAVVAPAVSGTPIDPNTPGAAWWPASVHPTPMPRTPTITDDPKLRELGETLARERREREAKERADLTRRSVTVVAAVCPPRPADEPIRRVTAPLSLPPKPPAPPPLQRGAKPWGDKGMSYIQVADGWIVRDANSNRMAKFAENEGGELAAQGFIDTWGKHDKPSRAPEVAATDKSFRSIG